MEMAAAPLPPAPRTVEDIFKDFSARRAALVRALTTDVDEFYGFCDPEKENLCLYGHCNGTWEVSLPAEEVPPEMPEPALGINFARDGMHRRDWLSLVAVHADSWLISVAFFFGARLNANERKRLFSLINDHPTVFEALSDRKHGRDGRSGTDNSGKSKHSSTKVESLASDGQLESPKGIPVARMALEDEDTNDSNFLKTKNTLDGRQTDNSIKDDRYNSISSSINSISLRGPSMKEPVRPKSSDESLESNSSQPKPIKKPARAKVPFEKGYSQMDWLKLTRTHPDLAGLKGQSNRRLISLEEVKQHKSGDYIWTVLKGRVYNIAPYLKFHPGGVDMLMKAAGKDCTALFNKYHAWVNAEFLLEKCLVGFLDPNE